jgi:glycosyltransferase involved in cell wall biosynthesis
VTDESQPGRKAGVHHGIDAAAASTELVSAIIPAFNRPGMLKEAIESALAQTHPEIEVLVVLNGATSETVETACRFRANPKVTIVEIARSTLAAARNAGIERARGQWVAFLDDDYIWLPEKTAVQLAAAHQSGADLVGCNFVHFNDAGDILESGLCPMPEGLGMAEALMLTNYLSGGSAAIVRTAAIRSLGGFDARLRASEDWDMWRRLSWDHAIHKVDTVLVKYRRHASNLTSDPNVMLQAEALIFGKLLEDTPERLRHMFPAAKQQYFESVKTAMLAQGISLQTTAAERIGKRVAGAITAVSDVANRLSLGLLDEAMRRLHARRVRRRAMGF